jgi:hypothetical protein
MIKWGDVELPGFDRPLRPVGPERRKILAALLDALLREIPSRPEPRLKATGPLPRDPAPPPFADACAACRGHCCGKGGNDAYLDETALRLAWARHPRLSKRALKQLYLDAIPTKAFKDSCIFHARNGCSLPRALRAPICNAFLCGPLERLAKG